MLGNFLQENILCLLAYNEQYAPIIRNSISLNLYSGPYRIIASRIYNFLDSFGKPPGDHCSDLLEDKLTADSAEGTIYKNTITAIRNTVEGLNTEFVINQIQIFIRRQSYRSVAVELTKALQRDTEEGLDEFDRLVNQARYPQLQLFDPGTKLSDKTKALKFLDYSNECFPTGIKELDDRGLGPTRKELILLVGNAKTGKSVWLTHLAKIAIINRLKVAHITLEMSEGRCAQRYFQTLFSIAKRPDPPSSLIKFKKDDYNKIINFEEFKIAPRHTLQDHDIKQKLEMYIDKWAIRQLDNIYIKEFPTSNLTMEGLEAYLDTLIATKNFIPDLVVVDYPDLMDLGREELRISLDRVFKRLRGLAVQRNIAVAAVSQANRSSAKSKILDGTGVSEAYSKIQHSDTIIFLSATTAEKRLGLARLSVIARNDEGNFVLVVSQNYRTGTFVVDSALMTKSYWEQLGEDENDSKEE